MQKKFNLTAVAPRKPYFQHISRIPVFIVQTRRPYWAMSPVIRMKESTVSVFFGAAERQLIGRGFDSARVRADCRCELRVLARRCPVKEVRSEPGTVLTVHVKYERLKTKFNRLPRQGISHDETS